MLSWFSCTASGCSDHLLKHVSSCQMITSVHLGYRGTLETRTTWNLTLKHVNHSSAAFEVRLGAAFRLTSVCPRVITVLWPRGGSHSTVTLASMTEALDDCKMAGLGGRKAEIISE